MAWDRTSGTRRDLPPNWSAICKETARRAGGRCEWILPSGARCPRKGTDTDHYGERWEHHKTRLLCPTHHKQRTQGQAQAARKPKTKTKPQRHPGQLRRQ